MLGDEEAGPHGPHSPRQGAVDCDQRDSQCGKTEEGAPNSCSLVAALDRMSSSASEGIVMLVLPDGTLQPLDLSADDDTDDSQSGIQLNKRDVMSLATWHEGVTILAADSECRLLSTRGNVHSARGVVRGEARVGCRTAEC
jgi:hypothetical protein